MFAKKMFELRLGWINKNICSDRHSQEIKHRCEHYATNIGNRKKLLVKIIPLINLLLATENVKIGFIRTMKYIATVIVIVVEYMVECDRWSIEVEGLWLTGDCVTKMGLSPYASEIHKDACTILSQNVISFFSHSVKPRVILQADRLMLENSEKATLNIKMPSNCLHDGLPNFQKSIC